MTTLAPPTAPTALAAAWLADLDAALRSRDPDALAALVLPDAWWRDLLALTGDLRTFQGADGIRAGVGAMLAAAAPGNVALDPTREPVEVCPAPGVRWVQAFFTLDVAAGRAVGLVRLMPPDHGVPLAGSVTQRQEGWRAWTVLTALDELADRPERTGDRREPGVAFGGHRGRASWAELRAARLETADPEVLVVGGGQSGLATAARLRALGVDVLVVERNARVGDNWRSRYRSLVLHDVVWSEHMPYLPFPEQWPVYTPKDKLADWLEAYALALEIDVWTGSELVSGAYAECDRRWEVVVRRPDGSQRTLHPRHLVLATGLASVPAAPDIPGREDFLGTVRHAARHPGGREFAGRRAVVVGAGTSGHDVAQDLYEHGAEVTMVQRSGTYVVSSDPGLTTFFAGFYEEHGPPTADADLLFAAFPFPLVLALHAGGLSAHVAQLDADLLDGLEKAGFAVDRGEDGRGLFERFLNRHGGYYIDVGASGLIADGRIGIRRGEVARLLPDGVELADGTVVPADLVVLSTGYRNMQEGIRALLGDRVADRVGPVWGLGEDGEVRNVWRRTPQPGLWIMGGNLQQNRFYSKYLALQIAADSP